MKKTTIKWSILLLLPCLLAAAAYLGMMRYYQKNIPYGTWINDIYCTGLDYDEAAARLLASTDPTIEIDVFDDNNTKYHIALDQELYTLSYREGLEALVSSKGVFGLFSEKHFTQTPMVQISVKEWEAFISDQPFLTAPDIEEGTERVYIRETENGFELIDLCTGVLDTQKAQKEILSAITAGQKQLSLTDAGCYKNISHTEEEKEILALYEQLQLFCNKITMDLTIQGETAFTINASVIKDWILKDKNGAYMFGKDGSLLIDYDQIKAFAKNVSNEVTTYFGKPWQFITHDNEVVEVEAGNFGRALKVTNLSDALIKAFDEGSSESYELEFVFYPESAAEIDYGAGYGTSYIEVDIEGQHVYLYLDGELIMDSPVVTGDVRRKRDTPKGVFYVEYKQRNRTLVGPNYRTPVSYWMHFYNHCGFHDAYWRKSFGDEIYINDGSHGCVNMPPEKAKELYENVYSGLPVIVY